MKSYWVLAAGTSLAIAAVAVWYGSIPEGKSLIGPSVAMGCVVFATAIASLLIRRRRERRDLTMESDSVEREAMTEAQAATFRDSLVVLVALGFVTLVWDPWPASFAMLVVVVILLADFNIRFARMKSAMVAEQQ